MEGLRIINELPLPAEMLNAYREANLRLPLSAPVRKEAVRRLAIVGSGPSLRKRFAELSDFDGEIWAINGAWRWLHEHGVEATFFSIDPLPIVGEFSRGAARTVLASQCDPKVFAARLADGAEVRCIRREALGSYSAIGAAVVALDLGFEEILLFGCECSCETSELHVDGRGTDEEGLVIGVGEEEFFTRAAYYQQALELSRLVGHYPKKFRERSGGLLKALVDCFDMNGALPEMPWLPQLGGEVGNVGGV